MSLLPVDEALRRILSQVTPLTSEHSSIDDAIGRALANSIVAKKTLPPWDNSAMDGYAVRAAEVAPGSVLKIAQRIFAGDRPTEPLRPGTCARIMTGAPMPPGADAVVMQERTSPGPDTEHVRIDEGPKPGANVRRRGEDIAEGAPLFEAGRQISLADAGSLWSQGLTHVEVHRAPRVSIATSGDELAEVGSSDPLRIIDSNTHVIAAAVRASRAHATNLGRAADTLESQRSLFAKGLEHDVLITIAGASVGDKDFTRDALVANGVSLDFWKVAMRPGKPLSFGFKGKTLVFGLPGNPVSAMVTFELFVRPALRKLMGLSPEPRREPARLAGDFTKAAGLRHFVRARRELREGEVWAVPLSTQSSGSLSAAAGADCLIEVDEAVTALANGSKISLLQLSWV